MRLSSALAGAGRIICIGVDLFTALMAALGAWESWPGSHLAGAVLGVIAALFLAGALALTTDRMAAWLGAVWLHAVALVGVWWWRTTAAPDPDTDPVMRIYAFLILPLCLLIASAMMARKRRALDRAPAATGARATPDRRP